MVRVKITDETIQNPKSKTHCNALCRRMYRNRNIYILQTTREVKNKETTHQINQHQSIVNAAANVACMLHTKARKNTTNKQHQTDNQTIHS